MKPGETKDIEARFPDTYNAAGARGKDCGIHRYGPRCKGAPGPRTRRRVRRAHPARGGHARRTALRSARPAGSNERGAGAPDDDGRAARKAVARCTTSRCRRSWSSARRSPLWTRRGAMRRAPASRGTTTCRERSAPRKTSRRGASEAERRVKTSLLFEAIARARTHRSDPGRRRSRARQLEQTVRPPPSEIVELLRPNMRALVDGIVRTKTIDFLIDRPSAS